MAIAPLGPALPAVSPCMPLELSLAAQLLVVVTAFGIKPLCMALNARYLWRFRSVRSPELRLAGCALAVFLAGETACALNYLVFASERYAVQALHDVGMAATFALLVRAALRAFEAEVVHSEDARRACALVPLCRRCVKAHDAPCVIVTAQRWTLAALALAALLPLTVPLRPVRYEALIFGRPAVLEHGLAEQVAEARVAPLIAAALFALAWRRRGRPDERLAAWGLGVAGFAWMRTMTAFPFLDAIVWMGFWEEASELALVLMVGKGMAGWARRQDARVTTP